MPGKQSTLFFIVSVFFLLLAIGFVAILTQRTTGDSADIRAKATTATALKLNATVVSFERLTNTLMVSNVQFADGEQQKVPGQWEVIVPINVDGNSFAPGRIVTIAIDAPTFNLATKKVTALSIE